VFYLNIKLDPWGHMDISDYSKLYELFGIEPIDTVIDDLRVKHRFFERRVVFGHRDMGKWIKNFYSGEKSIVLTGFMPSGHVHLGHLMVIEELRYFQKIGAKVRVVIADAEAYAVRRLDRDLTIKYGVEYIAHALAWGLDSLETDFYFQTNYSEDYYRLIHFFSRKVSFNEMEAIYGELTPAKIVSALTQVADILHSQLKEFGEYRNIIVPVGADQDPHIRLTRDLADRFSNELGFVRPSSMYHKFITGLDGNKMSSSRPDYAIFLLDDNDIVAKKIAMALTGGRATADEQRKLGGEPHKCSIYQLYLYFLAETDGELRDTYNDCISGKVLCGQCKKRALEKLLILLNEQRSRFRDVVESGVINKVVEKPKF